MKQFKLIVAGGRDFNNYHRLSNRLMEIAEKELAEYNVSIVSGMAKGADKLAHTFAKANDVVCYEFPADWDQYDKRAGFVRNEEMGRFADGLLGFWDGQSRGTKHMIDFMQRQGKPVFIERY